MRNALLLILVLSMVCIGHAQNFQSDYQIVRLDSSWDSQINPKLQKYVHAQRKKLNKKLDVVIGRCSETLVSYSPASPLSNFITDLMLSKAPSYVKSSQPINCDMAMINFGGIRAQLPAGNITIEHIYALSPFENHLAFIEIKGRELRKIFNRHTEQTLNFAFAGAQVTYTDHHPSEIKIQGLPLIDDKSYTIATIDFISNGGDEILKDIAFENITFSSILFRDFIIYEINNIHKDGKFITSKDDDRIIIENHK